MKKKLQRSVERRRKLTTFATLCKRCAQITPHDMTESTAKLADGGTLSRHFVRCKRCRKQRVVARAKIANGRIEPVTLEHVAREYDEALLEIEREEEGRRAG